MPTLVGRTEPRIWTPPLRPLVDHEWDADGTFLSLGSTRGYDAIRFANDVLGVTLFPWQEWLLIHALEINPDGSFRFRKIIVLVSRQNGKSLLSQVLSLFMLYVLGVRLILGTAQDLDTAEEVWDGAVEFIEGTPELRDLALEPVKVNGKKTIRLKTGERYKVKAAGRRAGRGLSGDLILLDELREHQSWDAWAAITKTTNARPNAQIWALSNAGDVSSVVLRYLRKMAHAALHDPDGINADDDPSKLLDPDYAEDMAVDADEMLGIFEWSAPPRCDVNDRDGWAQANPALGFGTITERVLASDARTDPEWTFRTECLCQWSDGTLEGPFPAGAWDAGRDDPDRATGHPGSSIGDDQPVSFCLDVAWDRGKAHIAAAGLRPDGRYHIVVIASRAGTDWVVPWFTDPDHPQRRGYRVAIQPSSPAGSLIDDLRDAGIDVTEWKGTDLGQSCGAFYDAVVERRVLHRSQPILDVAAATAVTRPMPGDAWVWDRKKSPIDAAPLMAVTGAFWLATHPVAVVEPFFAFG